MIRRSVSMVLTNQNQPCKFLVDDTPTISSFHIESLIGQWFYTTYNKKELALIVDEKNDLY